jgi:aminotransferase
LRAIILCTPANPTGKVFTEDETRAIADVCRELDLLCISDEVYEHYVVGERRHVSIAKLQGMWERTITVNSFSKSWNISGWRLGYVYGDSQLVAPLNNANNVFYVCSPTPLQRALAEVLMANPSYYAALRERFTTKRERATEVLKQLGFRVYDSGSAFYIWARIPEGYNDAMQLNEALIREAKVAGVPGSAFTESDDWDSYMRLCIAREDEILESAFGRLKQAFSAAHKA